MSNHGGTLADGVVFRVVVDAATEWLFLRLENDQGLTGLGEALLPGREPLVAAALLAYVDAAKGQCIEGLVPPPKPLADEAATGLFEATVHATIDQALWDLRARALGVPLYRLLGPVRRTEIPLYANINRGTRDRTPEGFAHRATLACDAGFEAVKIAPFDALTRANAHTAAGRQAFEAAVDRVIAVRQAVGTHRRLMIDCHCRLDLALARRFLDRTETTRIDWFEDALPYRDLESWTHLRAYSHAPLVGGETARGIRDLLPFLERGIWDVVMPDIRFFGGVSELVALAPLAAQYQVQIAPHNPRGPVATLASAHAMASCPVFDHLEYQFGEWESRDALTNGSERIVNGVLALSERPGLGLEWNEALAKASAPG